MSYNTCPTKYIIRRETAPNTSSGGGYNLSESISADGNWTLGIPIFAKLTEFNLWEADFDLSWSTDIGKIIAEHGWEGTLSYIRAKHVLKNVVCNDKNECIYFMKDHLALRIDWEASNFDLQLYMFSKDMAAGFCGDIVSIDAPYARHYTFYPKPKIVGDKDSMLRISLDQIKFASVDLSLFDVKLYSVRNPVVIPILGIIPFY